MDALQKPTVHSASSRRAPGHHMHPHKLYLNASFLRLTQRCYSWSFNAFLRIVFVSGTDGYPSCGIALSGDLTAGRVSMLYRTVSTRGRALSTFGLVLCSAQPCRIHPPLLFSVRPNMTSLLKNVKSAFVTAVIYSVQFIYPHYLKIAINYKNHMSFELIDQQMVSSACVFQLIN